MDVASDFTVTQIQAASRYRFFQRPNASRISERPAKVLMRLLYTWAFTASQGCSRSWGGGSFSVHSSWIPLILSDLREDNSKHWASKSVGSVYDLVYPYQVWRQPATASVLPDAGKTPPHRPWFFELTLACRCWTAVSKSQAACLRLPRATSGPAFRDIGEPTCDSRCVIAEEIFCKKKVVEPTAKHTTIIIQYQYQTKSSQICSLQAETLKPANSTRYIKHRLHIKYYRSYAGHSAWQWPPRRHRSHDPMGKSIGINTNAMYQRCSKDVSKMYQAHDTF